METLKIKFLLVFMFLTIISIAQNNYSNLQEAFKNSYKYENKGDYTKAIDEIKQHYSENSYEINLRLGWLYYLSGNQTESMKYYKKAIDLYPLSEEAKLGYVLPASAVGNWDDVLNIYLNILTNNPYNTTVLYRTGLIYYNKEQYSQAYKYFEKLINLYPFSYDGLIMFAWTNYKLGKYREAKLLFQKVLLVSPDDASAKEGLNLIK